MGHKIFIISKRKKIENIIREYPNAEIIDVTSKACEPWLRFSPFYAHRNIPVPFSKGIFSYSVEGIWQGLKVFETQNVDTTKFQIQNLKGIKRSVRKYGNVLGHRKGVNGTELLTYKDARKLIYLPSYLYTLNHFLQNEICTMKNILFKKNIILLDYETNSDVNNLRTPLITCKFSGIYY